MGSWQTTNRSSLERAPSTAESVTLMALLISLVALSIDAMLPALPQLGADLGARHPGDTPLVLSALFLGLSLGQLIAGPVSDSIGRRGVVLSGLAVYLVGSAICALSGDFNTLLLGRLIQGLGVAGPRVVTVAIVRDRYAGDAMARIMSFIMSVFILVPVVAPALGQIIADWAGWRAIFWGFLLLGALAGLWFTFRQPETLTVERRTPFTLTRIWTGIRETLRHPDVIGYIAAAGCVFGALVGYLASAQPIFADQYELGEQFPIYFAVLALAIGAASILNARLVMTLGMRRLMRLALMAFSLMSLAATGLALATGGHPPLWALMTYLMAGFFTQGILFGNLNAAAMEPLGHIAGLGSAVYGAATTLISLTLGAVIGRAYDGTVLPLVLAFTGLGLAALVIVLAVERRGGRDD
ncbi:MAG: multidrug effflux MFS transporter [Hyphomicrobiaceae bacterium]